jgi:hypothetical protein
MELLVLDLNGVDIVVVVVVCIHLGNFRVMCLSMISVMVLKIVRSWIKYSLVRKIHKLVCN